MSNGVGEQLRAAREARSWSVEEVASRLKIPARYVAALECGDDASLPEPTFVRGYIKAYAKAVGLDADALLAAAVPLEVRAPRPLIGPEGQAKPSRRTGTQVRAPSFRSPARRLPLIAVALAAGAAGVWFFASGPSGAPPAASAVPEPAAPAVVAAMPVPPPDAGATGAVTLAVPLPGAASLPPVTPAPTGQAVPTAAQPPVTLPSATPPAATPPVAAAATPPPAASPAVAPSEGASAAAPAAPRKGLHARFNGTCWVEVRDADNVVIHTRIAMAGNELNVDGKAPLTVTLGDAGAAELWYNGERVTADRFSSNGIARIIVGQAPR